MVTANNVGMTRAASGIGLDMSGRRIGVAVGTEIAARVHFRPIHSGIISDYDCVLISKHVAASIFREGKVPVAIGVAAGSAAMIPERNEAAV